MGNTVKEILIQTLRDADIFAGLADNDLEEIVTVCNQRTYQAGERCVVQGEDADELYIVNAGKVALELRLEVGPYTQTLNVGTLGRGNMFGWSSLVEPHVCTASVRCVEKAQILCMKASDLQRIFRERPSIERVTMKNLARIVSLRLRDRETQLVRLVAEMIKQGK